MKVKKAFWGVLLISGSLGVSAVEAHDFRSSELSQVRDQWTRTGDDSALPPGVPGVTDDMPGYISEHDAMAVEEALANNGYDPGRIDGMIDSDTQAAIREFQRDNDLAVTGTIDRETQKELRVSRYDSGQRAYPRS